MPKIPVFDQQQLASSAVGTPGIDQSGQIFWAAVSDAFGVAATANIQKEQREEVERQRLIREREAELKVLAREQQQALQNAKIAFETLNLDSRLDTLGSQITEDFKNNPEEWVEKLKRDGLALVTEYGNGIGDPIIRGKVLAAGAGSLQTNLSSMHGKALTQGTANAVTGFKNTLDKLEIQGGNAKTGQDLLNTLGDFDKAHGLIFRRLLGDAEYERLMTVTEQNGIKNYLSNQARLNPGSLAQSIDFFKNKLPGSENARFYEELDQIKKAREWELKKIEDKNSAMLQTQMTVDRGNDVANTLKPASDKLADATKRRDQLLELQKKYPEKWTSNDQETLNAETGYIKHLNNQQEKERKEEKARREEEAKIEQELIIDRLIEDPKLSLGAKIQKLKGMAKSLTNLMESNPKEKTKANSDQLNYMQRQIEDLNKDVAKGQKEKRAEFKKKQADTVATEKALYETLSNVNLRQDLADYFIQWIQPTYKERSEITDKHYINLRKFSNSIQEAHIRGALTQREYEAWRKVVNAEMTSYESEHRVDSMGRIISWGWGQLNKKEGVLLHDQNKTNAAHIRFIELVAVYRNTTGKNPDAKNTFLLLNRAKTDTGWR